LAMVSAWQELTCDHYGSERGRTGRWSQKWSNYYEIGSNHDDSYVVNAINR
jgi:hypothetical protein